MLQAVTSTKAKRSFLKTEAAAPAEPTTNPPPVVAAPDHPVWGRVPVGSDKECRLERQPIWTLNHWHKRTTSLLDAATNEAQIKSLGDLQWEIFNAAQEVPLVSGRGVAALLQLTLRHMLCNVGEEGSLEFLDMQWLKGITEKCTQVTEFPKVKKPVGDLQRSGKLTRAGLLLRYHAFLIGELHTVSWNLYGNRDYGASMVPVDSEVTRRTKDGFKDGEPLDYNRRRRSYPFFDESKLTTRARNVLGSLKISTTKPDRR